MNDNAIIFTGFIALLLAWACWHSIKERRAAKAKAQRTVGDDLRDAIKEADRKRLEESGVKELAEHMESYWSTRGARLRAELEALGGVDSVPGFDELRISPAGMAPTAFASAAGAGQTQEEITAAFEKTQDQVVKPNQAFDSFPEGAGQGRARHEATSKADESMATFGFYRQPGE